ncbi:MAG: hypothetical protein HY547_03250, partial [Elusimicrobia bacterium]|nr:hypothetical protein [Elusimicrobiota bacterium]
ILYSIFNLEAAHPSLSDSARMHTPAKATSKEEAVLFKQLSGSITGVGLLNPDEKKLMSQTIEKEKANVLRRTMEQVYYEAFDLYRKGKYADALEILNRIITLDPSYDRARSLQSALASISANQIPGFLAAPKSLRDLIQERFYQALDVYRDGRKVEAVAKFEEVMALEPKHRKARYYINRINSEIAKEYFERGKFAQSEGRLEDALQNYYTAVSLDPVSYALLSRQITEVEGTVRSKKVEHLLSEALKELTAGNWSASRQNAKGIFELDPANARAQELINESLEQEAQNYVSRGDRYFRDKQYDQAIATYEKLIKMNYRAAEARKKIDLVNARIKEEEEAARKREEAEKARLESEERAKAAATEKEKARVVTAGAEGPEGIGGAPAAITEEAKRAAESHYQQAMQFYQSGDLQRALGELNIALKFDPNNQNVYAAKRMIEQKLAK